MAIVLLPALLAAEAGGRNRFETDAGTVGDALRALPVANLLFDEHGELRPLVNVYVDGFDARERGGLEAPLAAGAELRVVQAVAGGQRSSATSARAFAAYRGSPFASKRRSASSA